MDYTNTFYMADLILTVQPGETDVLSGIVSSFTNAGFTSVRAAYDEFGGVNVSMITSDGKKVIHTGIHHNSMRNRTVNGCPLFRTRED